MGRGRPKHTMTHRRQQVLESYIDLVQDGQAPRVAELVRRCALHDRSSAKRILRDLKAMGEL